MSTLQCRNFERWIVLDMEGELSPRQKEKLANHLKSCTLCREISGEYQIIRTKLSSLPLEPVPMMPPIRTLLPEVQEQRGPASRRMVLVPVGIGLVLLLGSVILFQYTRPPNLKLGSPYRLITEAPKPITPEIIRNVEGEKVSTSGKKGLVRVAEKGELTLQPGEEVLSVLSEEDVNALLEQEESRLNQGFLVLVDPDYFLGSLSAEEQEDFLAVLNEI
ncbi:MAG: zf-HC2 domain-containing protein [Candidatus Omnitrophota bacterium]